MPDLHVDSVRKSFGTRQLLTDIFLSCRPGDVIALLGRNGSGKSTLLQIIFGSMRPDNMFVRVDDRIVTTLRHHDKQIAYLPQHCFLPGHLKISRIIKVFCSASNIENVSAHPHVKPFLNRKPGQLSGGEKRLIEIILIVNSGATYILVDEPFNAIEPIQKEVVKEIIRTHAPTKGFVITDHDYKNVLDVATSVMLLHNGGTRLITTTEDLVRWGYLHGL
jgi:ABC-type multidrug transport system ATPase subunit